MTLRYISPTNAFLPEMTGQVIAYVRKESDFSLNKYVQYVDGPTLGVYCKMGRDQFVRRVTDAEFAWEDGDERPRGEYQKVPFELTEYRTFRRDYPWSVGNKAIATAKAFKPKAVHASMAISIAMTNRTARVVSLLETSSNWGTHTADANTLNGGRGNWANASGDPTSPNYLAIFRSLVEMGRRINLATNAVVKPNNGVCVVSPGLAIAMSQTSEIHEYCKESQYAKEILEKGMDPQYQLFGLPATYKGFTFVVEDSPMVDERAKASGVEATTNRDYIKADSTAIWCSRPGGLDGEYGAPSFSTVQLYHYGGLLEVEGFDDAKNRRYEGHVSEDIKEVLASSVSGFLVTNTM